MTYRLTTTCQDFKEEILAKYPMIANFEISEKETEMHNGMKRNVLFIKLYSLGGLEKFKEAINQDLIFLYDNNCSGFPTLEIYDTWRE